MKKPGKRNTQGNDYDPTEENEFDERNDTQGDDTMNNQNAEEENAENGGGSPRRKTGRRREWEEENENNEGDEEDDNEMEDEGDEESSITGRVKKLVDEAKDYLHETFGDVEDDAIVKYVSTVVLALYGARRGGLLGTIIVSAAIGMLTKYLLEKEEGTQQAKQ